MTPLLETNVRPPSVTCALALLIVAASANSGCKPHIDRFSANPLTLCPGTVVTLAWKTQGSAKLSLAPAGGQPSERRLERSGTIAIEPRLATLATLTAERASKTVGAQQEIAVWQPDAPPLELGASLGDLEADPHCSNEARQFTVVVHARAYDPRLRVASITAHPRGDRAYSVEHASVTAALAPGETSRAFADLEVGGDWSLRAALRADEDCAATTLPRNLIFQVLMQCDREATR